MKYGKLFFWLGLALVVITHIWMGYSVFQLDQIMTKTESIAHLVVNLIAAVGIVIGKK